VLLIYPLTMCDICRKKLGSLALPHKEEKCAFAASSYCGYCSQYGHSSKHCVHHSVDKSETIEPIPTIPSIKPILDVVETPQCIRSVLSSFGVKLSGIPKENVRRLRHIAECGKCQHLEFDNEEREKCLYSGKPPCETEKGKILILHAVAKKRGSK
jgi:hypothetical protein